MTILDRLKSVVLYLFNPYSRPVRDSGGKVIDDWRRRRHSKQIQKKLESGELKRPGYHGTNVTYQKGEKPKCFRVETKASVKVKKHEEI